MKKVIVFFLVIIMWFPTLVSCSSETDKNNFNYDRKKEAKFILKSASIIKNELNNSLRRDPLPTEIDQETLDNYANLIGYEEGDISLEMVNSILQNISMAINDDISIAINQTPYSNYTKQILISLSEGEWIPGLSETLEFAQLSIDEKEILLVVNSVMEEISNNEDEPKAGWLLGLYLGAITGTSICGPPCGIVGGIVGIVVGGITDEMKNP